MSKNMRKIEENLFKIKSGQIEEWLKEKDRKWRCKRNVVNQLPCIWLNAIVVKQNKKRKIVET